MRNIFAVTAVVFLLMTACAQNFDPATEKAAVKDVLNRMMQAMTSKDMKSFAGIVAHDTDMVNFGTDATERWVGWDALKSSVEQQFEAFDKMQMAERDQVIKVGACGKTAWFSQIMDWNLEAGGNPVNIRGMRVTGVLEKRDDKWLVVQIHFSIGVAGQAAEY